MSAVVALPIEPDIAEVKRLERLAAARRVRDAYDQSDHFECGALSSHEILDIVVDAILRVES